MSETADLNFIIAQAQTFVKSIASLVNDANKLRVESVGLKHENNGLVADNQRLQKEIDGLEGKMVLLEERISRLEKEQGQGPDAQNGDTPEPLSQSDTAKAEFLARLSRTPRDWYVDDAGCIVRDEFAEHNGRKLVISLAPLQAIYYEDIGFIPRSLLERENNAIELYGDEIRALGGTYMNLIITKDDLPAIREACGIT